MRENTPDNKTSDGSRETQLITVEAEVQNFRRRAVIVAIGLAAVTIAAYWGVRNSKFISFDDPYYVTNNYFVKGGLSPVGVKWAFTSFYASNWHPLTWLSHMLDMELFGLTPAGPHFVNLSFHVLSALLLLSFLLYTTKRLWPSAFVAAMFALHPLHVESVAWVSERKDVLSTCFWMFTILAWALYVRKPSRGRYILALVSFALGLMAKPMLVMLPIVLLLLDYWPLGRIPAEPARSRRKKSSPLWPLIVEKLPFAALSVASAATTILAQQRVINPREMMDAPTVLTNAVVSYGRYMWKMIWPANLAVYYPHPYKPLVVAALSVGLLIVIVTIFVMRHRRSHPYLLAGWLWYLVTLIPVIGIVQVGNQSHADRYTYVPLTGLFIIAAWGAADLAASRGRAARLATAILAIAVPAASAVATYHTVGYWRDGMTLFSHAVAVSPGNAKMETSLGASLADEGRIDEAIAHLEKAVRDPRHDGSAFNPLGTIYVGKGDNQRAIRYFTEAATYEWMDTRAEYCLGAIYIDMRQFDTAAVHLARAVQLDPYSADAYGLLATALIETGKSAEAKAACEKAIGLEPGSPASYYARGHILAKEGNYAAAAKEFEKSISLKPRDMAYSELADALFRLGRLGESLENYRQAALLDPNNPEVLYNVAFVLERLGEKEKAIEQLDRVLKITPEDRDAQAMRRRLTGSK